MNRPIKFRVYADAPKGFLYYEWIPTLGFILKGAKLEDKVEIGEEYAQQYTGLKDINGKEIYEGDIVRNTSEQFVNENFTGVVTYSDCFFGLELINGEPKEWRGIDSDMEVIGNIYEECEKLV